MAKIDMTPDPAKNKQLALRFATRAAKKADRALLERDAALVFALEHASLREVADATGIPHVTVKRIADRHVAAED